MKTRVLAPLLALLAACSDVPTDLPLGETVTVQFRRDALGGGANLPVPPTTNSVNGAEVSLTGKLLRVDFDWILLDVPGSTSLHWIDIDSVLLVSVPRGS